MRVAQIYRVRRTIYMEGRSSDFWYAFAFIDRRCAGAVRRKLIRQAKNYSKLWKIMGVRQVSVHIKPLEVI